MDADVLALRNRMHRRLAPRGVEGGYALYLAGFAGSLLRGAHGGTARLSLDGVRESCTLYNLAVVNTPIYAGPFRFDGANDSADGLLDVHAVTSAGEYLAEYPSAWVRHLRVQGGAQPRAEPAAAPRPRDPRRVRPAGGRGGRRRGAGRGRDLRDPRAAARAPRVRPASEREVAARSR